MKRSILALAAAAVLGCAISATGQDSSGVRKVGALYHKWETARAVAVQGDFAYVATGATGLSILNISNPDLPREVGFLDYGGIELDGAMDVAVAGDYAYVID